jgi:predicted SAM-dependent methyltransferase
MIATTAPVTRFGQGKGFRTWELGNCSTIGRKMLNLGCGGTYHPDWINIDIAPVGPGVIACDFRNGLPFPEDSFDVVYHSHVLEHFTRDEGEAIMGEAVRVLKLGGAIRVAVPDLEQITLLYLTKLAAVIAGEEEARDDHEWMMLELLDQMVRQRGGGLMKEYLLRPNLRNTAFVRTRIGAEFDAIFGSSTPVSLLERIQRKGVGRIFSMLRERAARVVVHLVGGPRARATYERGVFRDSGEVHKWMYDRYTLARLMERVGIVSVTQCDAMTSCIPNFAAYGLDAVNGLPRKPDSLYMEGIKRRS